ncbi:hypothetical protein BpHYR1_020170 [Brachionus plicatilis]|uniref:Uncharacterized protein n=1 Tax=Brachionus plicatilis TaxID=10195 RepID=A0A3M7PIZ3_BRAPC|nr:hypothetical protein BpHYR1_020170 [Brachionus plicatilis]
MGSSWFGARKITLPDKKNPKPTERNRSGESYSRKAQIVRRKWLPNRKTDPSPSRGIHLYPDSQISVSLDTLLGALVGRGRGLESVKKLQKISKNVLTEIHSSNVMNPSTHSKPFQFGLGLGHTTSINLITPAMLLLRDQTIKEKTF